MFAALEVGMWNVRLPEDFSTTLLSMLFAMLREKGSRATVLNLQVMLPDGPGSLKAVFPMSDETEVWMCRDLWSIWDGGRGATEEDKNLFRQDRKSTRLNSSHVAISYAVFCLKKKKKKNK